MDENSVAERVGFMVEQSGMKITDLAKEMGVARQSISQIMAGGTKPSFPILLKFRQVLNVDLNWLITGEGQEPAPTTITIAHLDKVKRDKDKEKDLEIKELQLKAREEKMELKLKLSETELKSCKMEVEYLKRLLGEKA